VLEGGEGAGKSTLAAALAKRFEQAGIEAAFVREPGGTAAGEAIRALLHQPLTPWAEAFAFLLARAQLVAEVIRPALDRGAFVVCDRFAASTFAYQGYARALNLVALRAANDAATGKLTPALTLFLDMEPGPGLARKLGEIEAIRTGLETIEFHRRVREGYLALMADAPPDAWLRIDATMPPEQVAETAWRAISRTGGPIAATD
jgi:dTMP kinase